jgi:hypothetical protein
MLGPTGLSSTALKVGSNLHKLQTGYIYHYTLYFNRNNFFIWFKTIMLIF